MIAGFALIVTPDICAQENSPWKVDFRTDIFSRHLWRGDQLGNTPAIEPEICLTKGKFGFSVWGATTFNDSYNEIDIILNYEVLPFLNFSFYDYYNPVPEGDNECWKYTGEKMRHSFELTGNFQYDNFPLSLLTGVFLYGDKDSVSGNERYSTYIEPALNFKIAGKDFKIFSGFTPFNGYYADGFSFVNIGAGLSESISLNSKIELPVQVKFCTNPSTNKTWFIVGIGIKIN